MDSSVRQFRIFEAFAASRGPVDGMIGGASRYEATQETLRWHRERMGEFRFGIPL